MISAGALLPVLLITVLILFRNELRSLTSLAKVDDYGMYQMTYYGDYGFDEFLEIGASNDSDIEAFVTKRLLKGLPIDLVVTGDGCTAFVVKNESGDILYGRNFDFQYAPSLQVYTTPDHGYASVSTVNLAFAGYSADNVEYFDQALQVVETNEEYQIASNFIAYNELNIGEGNTEFERYNKVQSATDYIISFHLDTDK